MVALRANYLSVLSLVLATAAFINTLLPTTPTAHGAPGRQDAPAAQAAPQDVAAVQAVPSMISYQGTLRDAEGKPMSGNFDLTFRIYDAPTAGAELWSEAHSQVTARDGRFTVLLGNNTGMPGNLFNNPNRYIGVQVAGFNEMAPRQRFASVPYAVQAQNADRALGLNGPGGTPLDAVAVHATGNIGIGTTNPLQKLHVAGSYLRVDGRGIVGGANDGQNKELAYIGGEHGDNVQVGSFNPNIRWVDMWNMATSNYMNLATQDVSAQGNIHTAGSVNAAGSITGQNFNATGNINASGNFSLDGQPPIRIRHYNSAGNNDFDTNYPTDKFECGIFGFTVDGDIEENGTRAPLLAISTYRSNGTWWVSRELATLAGTWQINVICIDKRLAVWE